MRTILQVLLGSLLWIVLTAALTYSSVPFFWEHEDEPHVYTLTWRSGIAALVLFAAAQWIAALWFRSFRRRRG